MRRIIIALPIFALTACSATQQATVLGDAQTAISAANTALTDYGIAKGIALAAEAADPALAPAISAALLVSDSYVAKLQAAVNASTLDLAAITTLVGQINAQALAITQQGAPVIKVVPSTTTGAKP
jgi:hypothetical protein